MRLESKSVFSVREPHRFAEECQLKIVGKEESDI